MIVVISLHRDFMPSSWGMYCADAMGLDDVCRIDWAIPDAVLSVYPLSADDLDF